jgi:rhodanese-related sulfurtransferase
MSFLQRMFGGPATPRLHPNEYKARFMDGHDAHTLLDVRTPEEFAAGSIPGAQNIALQELGRKLDGVPEDKPVVLYCRSGSRSAMAAQMMLQAGYSDVYDLGGIIDWAAHGLPIQTGKR